MLAALLLCLIAAAAVIIATGGSGATRGHQVGPSGPVTATGTSTVANTGSRLTTDTFTAMLPAGWMVSQRAFPRQGYTETIVKSGDGTVIANIDVTPDFTGTMAAHLASVQAAIQRTTPGYTLISQQPTTIAGAPAIVWKFTVPNDATMQRVDIYRVLDHRLYAVLAVSNAMSDSEAAASSIAASIRSR